MSVINLTYSIIFLKNVSGLCVSIDEVFGWSLISYELRYSRLVADQHKAAYEIFPGCSIFKSSSLYSAPPKDKLWWVITDGASKK